MSSRYCFQLSVFALVLGLAVILPGWAQPVQAAATVEHSLLDLTIHGRVGRWYSDQQLKFFVGYTTDRSVTTNLNQVLSLLQLKSADLQRVYINLDSINAKKLTDSDKDGLPDQVELLIGSDPNSKDSNHNGYSNFSDLYNGYSPLPAYKGQKLAFYSNVMTALKSAGQYDPAKVSCGQPFNYAGKSYDTTQIGSQCWMKDNLDVGVMILGSQRAANNKVIEKYCYDDKSDNCTKTGGLYTYAEATQADRRAGAQGICPGGWHLPTQAEQKLLDQTLVDGNDWAFRFGLAFSGIKLIDGTFNYPGVSRFWSSSAFDPYFSWLLDISGSANRVYQYYAPGDYGLSVRCLRNA